MKEKMEEIIQALKKVQDWTSKFEAFSAKNNLSGNSISKLQAYNIQSLNKHLLKLQKNLYSRSQENREKNKISWVSTEYQALEIVLNAISVITEKIIENFTNAEWTLINKIFPYKIPLTIKYESLRIFMEKKQPRRRWVSSEQNFLIEIVRGFTKKNKWNDVARQLFIRSCGQFFRQGKHCRERWLNHLHPSIQNNDWTSFEDIKLLTFVLKKGKKWARIAKKFDMKRSQCMVKKRFYELIKIQEQEGVPIQTLRNFIKGTLQELKSEVSQKKNQIKEGVNFQQFVDKNYRKCSTGKGNQKNDAQIKSLQFQVKSQQRLGVNEQEKMKSSKTVECSSTSRQSGSQYYSNRSLNNDQWMQNNFSYCFDYVNYMSSMMNPFYANYSPLIMPIQNNITINQGSQQQSQFQRF